MRRCLALYSMFALFACAYATLDRVPSRVLSVLRGGAEHVIRTDEAKAVVGPLA